MGRERGIEAGGASGIGANALIAPSNHAFGQQVFDADSPMQLIMKHVTNQPVAPSLRTDRRIPPALDAVVLSCLAKSPADRPQSAAALARALAEVDVEDWGETQRTEWYSAPAGDSVAS